jgi:hypothetical protein
VSRTQEQRERKSPPLKDSDIMWLAIRKLEAVAAKMEKLEYDEALDALMESANAWFEWAAFNMARRDGKVPDRDEFTTELLEALQSLWPVRRVTFDESDGSIVVRLDEEHGYTIKATPYGEENK